MHDLKHTLFFETLLEEPFNDLVKQAVEKVLWMPQIS